MQKYGVGRVIFDNTTLPYIAQPTYGVGHSLFLFSIKKIEVTMPCNTANSLAIFF
jgi:hypothetical protein